MLKPLRGEKLQRCINYERRHPLKAKLSRKRSRKKHLTRHHDHAKSLGGTYDSWNIFKLSEEHHQAYHKLFGLRTFDQAASVLLRMKEFHHQVA